MPREKNRHPVVAGTLVGSMEISVTYPIEYVKTQLQLQQQASAMVSPSGLTFRGPLHCFTHTLQRHGVAGLYAGGASWIAFAGPRSAVRFSTFESLSTMAQRAGVGGSPAADTACGLFAGILEGALCQTPSQAIAIKMIHDQSPQGPKRYKGFFHAIQMIHAEHGVARGFFCGMLPAVAKGAATNAIRFPVFGAIKRALQRDETRDAPLPPAQAVLAGGVAGAVSAVATQPIDVVKANMMGLEADRFASTAGCTRALVAAGGIGALFQGLTPRVVRVFIEVGLQFALYEQISPILDRVLG